MNRIRLLVCDLDNTLYDWVSFFVPAFYAMVDEATKILGCDRDQLLDDLKLVHQKYHDAEHPFALLETKIVTQALASQSLEDRRRLLDPAFKAFNSIRKKNLQLYPGVQETLTTIRDRGIKLVAHSESRVYNVMFRMKFLELTSEFEKIYCLERPPNTLADPSRAEQFWNDFPTDKIVEVEHRQRKPNPGILREMLADFALEGAQVAYVGDSIAKDVFMAEQAGCPAIWAKYGTNHDPIQYQELVRISHWTPDEIAHEANLRERTKDLIPDFVANDSFAEVLKFI